MLTLRSLNVRSAEKPIVRDLSIDLPPGSRVGLVGESGSGKTVTALAALRLLPAGLSATGEVLFDGHDLLRISDREMAAVRGCEIGLVLQDPYQAFSPVFKLGTQFRDALLARCRFSREETNSRILGAVSEVGLSPAESFVKNYPHKLSGGELQRLSIALALALEPKMLILDEPTSSVDAVTQEEILQLISRLQKNRRFSMLVISHDFHVIRSLTDWLNVMYAGEIVESGETRAVCETPTHPYTRALISALPAVSNNLADYSPLAGDPPSAGEHPAGCAFHPRCPIAHEDCSQLHPPLRSLVNREVRCPHV